MIDCTIDSPHLGLHKKLLSGPGLCGGQVQKEGVAHLVQVRLDTTLIQVTYLVKGRIEVRDLKIVCALIDTQFYEGTCLVNISNCLMVSSTLLRNTSTFREDHVTWAIPALMARSTCKGKEKGRIHGADDCASTVQLDMHEMMLTESQKLCDSDLHLFLWWHHYSCLLTFLAWYFMSETNTSGIVSNTLCFSSSKNCGKTTS